MNKIIVKSFVCFVTIFSLVSCAQLKEAGKDVGHATREVTTEIGHATKDVTTKIGHASRDTVKAIGKGTGETVNDIQDSSDK